MLVSHALQAPGTWPGGTTRAIYAYPPDGAQTSATARFWIGTAWIERAAAYSFFPGRQRIHLPVRGQGLRLAFQDPTEVVALDTFEQYRFDGARRLWVELVNGPVEAFNLIFETDVVADAQVLHSVGAGTQLSWPSSPLLTGAADLVVRAAYVVVGALELSVGGSAAVSLGAGDAFVLPPRAVPIAVGDRIEMRCLTDAVDIVVATVVFDPGA